MSDPIYGVVADYQSYWADRGSVALVGADAGDMAAELLKASDYLDNRFRNSFPGLKVGLRAQVREWPRTGAFDQHGYVIPVTDVPTEMTRATYEVAMREHLSPGSLTTDVRLNEVVHSATVFGAVSVDFASSRETFNEDDLQLKMPIVDEILAPILTGYDGGFSSLSGEGSRV